MHEVYASNPVSLTERPQMHTEYASIPPAALPVVARAASTLEAGSLKPEAPSPAPPATGSKAERLAQRARELAPCAACALCKERTQVVYGVGNPDARLMFIGEG